MTLCLYGREFASHLIIGTASYPSLDLLKQSIISSCAEVVTVSVKRHTFESNLNRFWEQIESTGCTVLPNTAGCKTLAEAVFVAELSKEIFRSNLIKLEIIDNDYDLLPSSLKLVQAAEKLISMGFDVMPYCTDDISVCRDLIASGCKVLMPLAAPIGSGQGIRNYYGMLSLRENFPDITMIVDAGIGTPSDAVKAMEMGYDGVLLNSSIAYSDSPVKMADAFRLAVLSGRLAFEAKRMPTRLFGKQTTPLEDTIFWR